MSKRKGRTRVIHGCKECRIKHTKCVLDKASGSCKRCLKIERPCEWDSKIKFKAVTSITEKVADNKKRRFDFTYDPEQVWVQPARPVTFHTSTVDEQGPAHNLDSESLSPSLDRSAALQPEPQRPGKTTATPRSSHAVESPFANTPSDRPHLPSISDSFPFGELDRPPSHPAIDQFYPTSFSDYTHHPHSPVTSLVAAQRSVLPSPEAGFKEQRTSSLFSPVPLWPELTPKESKLVRNYVDKLSAWIDATDSKRHFGTEVVRRTNHYPVLLYAVLAYSSLHTSRMQQGEDELKSAEYHNRCLEIIIKTLGDGRDSLDENLLAAIVILRGYEEISELDPRTHIQGSTRLLNSSSRFASSGGLGEAACWITLRQEIYTSLTSSQPINTNLKHYERSQAMILDDHDAWANRITLVFAKILAVIFRENAEVDWHGLSREVEAWYEGKPSSFEPIMLPWEEEGKKTEVFPNIWMLDSAQVVGMQNYYMARIVLATFNPRLSGKGFHSFRARKEMEDDILKDLRIVIGLAIHNEIVQSAIFQASHILSMCGFCLRDKKEQEAAIEFLKQMQLRTGWTTTRIINSLQSQWI